MTAMEEEFDTEAGWTADAVRELGPDYAIPAGCRGSGSPSALSWLGTQLGLRAGMTLLDDGAGVGGAAEFAREQFGVDLVLAEPALGACRAARTLFDRPTVAAAGEKLPFASVAFDAAWCLGVLCTADDQLDLLRELARVVRPGGPIGLLVFVRTVTELPEQPEGNDFPSADGLYGLLDRAGLVVRAEAGLSDFPDAPPDWQRRVEAVEAVIERDHGQDHSWQVAAEQQRVIGDLLNRGLVVGRLLVVARTSIID